MKKMLTNNLGLKAVSILFALILWLIVVNVYNPISTATFANIPVEVLNEESITDKGKVYSVLDGSNVISIRVQAQRSVLDDLSSSDFRATADMDELTLFENVPIEVEALRYKAKIESIEYKTKNMKVEIEDRSVAQFAIEISLLGNPKPGYAVGAKSLSQNVVKISGPDSIVDTISQVVAEVDIENMASDINIPVNLKAYDKNQNLVESNQLSFSVNSVDVYVKMLETKGVVINASTQGIPMDGYAATGEIICNPATVTIGAKKNILESITSITIPPEELDIAGRTESLKKTIDLNKYLNNEAVLIGTSKVEVTVVIEPLQMKEIQIQPLSIDLLNKPDEYSVSFLSYTNITVIIKGLAEDLENFDITTVKAGVDLTGLGEGTHNIPLIITLPSGFVLAEEEMIDVKIVKHSTGETDVSDADSEEDAVPVKNASSSNTANAAKVDSNSSNTNDRKQD